MSRLGVVSGLRVEADCLGSAAAAPGASGSPLVFCSGGDAARAADGARRLVADGAAALLSFGVAGGLDPALRPGRLVLAEEVVAPQGARYATDAAWRSRLHGLLGEGEAATLAVIAGSDRVIVSVAAKREAFAVSRAVAVDMESHAVASVAAAAGVPFAALRAVADPAWRAVPEAALVGLAPDGSRRPLSVRARLLVSPRQAPDLVRLAFDSAAALAALRRVAALGPSVLAVP